MRQGIRRLQCIAQKGTDLILLSSKLNGTAQLKHNDHRGYHCTILGHQSSVEKQRVDSFVNDGRDDSDLEAGSGPDGATGSRPDGETGNGSDGETESFHDSEGL